RVYRLHILPAPSSLNPSSHQDRLKRSSSEDARVADQQEPSPCPRQKHSVTRPNTVSSRPSTPTPTVDSKPTLPSTEFRCRSSVMKRATSWTALPGLRSPRSLATNAPQ